MQGALGILLNQDRPPQNLLTATSQFNGYTKSNATVNSDVVAAPDGTTTADRIVGNAVNNLHRLTRTGFVLPNNGTYTFSCYAKADQHSIALGISNGKFSVRGYDLTGDGNPAQWSNDSIGVSMFDPISNITKVDNTGWYRCELSVRIITTLTVTLVIDLSNGTTDSFASSTSNGAWLWGDQLESGSRAGPFIQVP